MSPLRSQYFLKIQVDRDIENSKLTQASPGKARINFPVGRPLQYSIYLE